MSSNVVVAELPFVMVCIKRFFFVYKIPFLSFTYHLLFCKFSKINTKILTFNTKTDSNRIFHLSYQLALV